MTYLKGGKFAQNQRQKDPCNQTADPIDDKQFMLKFELYFAHESPEWPREDDKKPGGVAFVKTKLVYDDIHMTYGRAYLITLGQLRCIAREENGGNHVCITKRMLSGNLGTTEPVEGATWYGTLLRCGHMIGGVPAVTLTDSDAPQNRPSNEYLDTIRTGLNQRYPEKSQGDIDKYLDREIRAEKPAEKPAADQEEPPFTVKSMVEFCWAMTFNLSHVVQQNDLGKIFNTEFFKMLENSNAKFSNDFTLRLAQNLRTMAFTRDAHVRLLNSNAKDLAEKRKFWADITQLASFSKEGLPMQIISFLGAGSFAQLYKLLYPNNPSTAEHLNNTIAHLTTVPNSTQYFANLTHAIANLTQSIHNASSSFFSTQSLSVFLLAGAIGVVVVTILLKVIGTVYVGVQKRRIKGIQDKYYKEQFKQDMADPLFNFYKDIKELVEAYYPNYRKGQMYQSDIIDCKDDQVRKELILDKILPPDKLIGGSGRSLKLTVINPKILQQYAHFWILMRLC
jgi:hypothetical protein